MPIYEYKGKYYDLSETDPSAAKTKIQSHLGESVVPKQEKMPRSVSAGMRRMQAPGYQAPAQEQIPTMGQLGQQYEDVAKATGAELGQLATGAGELLPGAAGEASARGTQYLKGVAEQAAQRTPGAGQISKALSLAAPIPGISRYLSGAKSLAQLARRGAGTGAAIGATAPTGSADIERKVVPIAVGAALGGAIPAAGLGYDAATAATKRYADVYSGRTAAKAQEELRGQVSELGREASTTLKGQAESLRRAEEAERAAIKDIRESRFKARQKIEGQLANVEKEQKSSLNALSEKPVKEEEIGSLIQNKGKENVENIKKTTRTEAIQEIKDPAFQRIREREARGDFIETNEKSKKLLQDALDDLDKQLSETPEAVSSVLRTRLAAITGYERPLTEGEKRAAAVRASITGEPVKETVREPLTGARAEYLRRWLKSKDATTVEGFPALDAVRAGKIGDKIQKALEAYEAGVGKYISRYKAGKEAEKIALGARGESTVESIAQVDGQSIFSMKPQTVARSYLDGTDNSARNLIRLVGGKTPELSSAVRGYIRNVLEPMNAKRASEWLTKNEGMLNVFNEAKPIVSKIIQDKQNIERLSSMRGKSTARIGELQTDIGKIAAKTQRLQGAEKINTQLAMLEQAQGKDIFRQSQKIADDLLKSNLLDQSKYNDLTKQIYDIERMYGETQSAKNRVKYAIYAAAAPLVGTTAYYKLKGILGI